MRDNCQRTQIQNAGNWFRNQWQKHGLLLLCISCHTNCYSAANLIDLFDPNAKALFLIANLMLNKNRVKTVKTWPKKKKYYIFLYVLEQTFFWHQKWPIFGSAYFQKRYPQRMEMLKFHLFQPSLRSPKSEYHQFLLQSHLILLLYWNRWYILRGILTLEVEISRKNLTNVMRRNHPK